MSKKTGGNSKLEKLICVFFRFYARECRKIAKNLAYCEIKRNTNTKPKF